MGAGRARRDARKCANPVARVVSENAARTVAAVRASFRGRRLKRGLRPRTKRSEARLRVAAVRAQTAFAGPARLSAGLQVLGRISLDAADRSGLRIPGRDRRTVLMVVNRTGKVERLIVGNLRAEHGRARLERKMPPHPVGAGVVGILFRPADELLFLLAGPPGPFDDGGRAFRAFRRGEVWVGAVRRNAADERRRDERKKQDSGHRVSKSGRTQRS